MSHVHNPLARTATSAVVLAAVVAGALSAGVVTASAVEVTPVSLSVSQVRPDVVAAVNAVRAQQGCRQVKLAKRLTKAAQGHADDMTVTGVFSHTSADGRSWITRIRATGWKRPGGENIAKGFGSVPEVMTAWMNSPDHRRNILNCTFRYIGVGYNPVGDYWVQDFGY
jgi:uncharacterized protein YkwD